MEMNNGIFCISLDFELYWGLRDKRNINEYEENLRGSKDAIVRLLKLFDEFEIHATWATVGFLFAEDIDELKEFFPLTKPGYYNSNLNPYSYIQNNKKLYKNFHFAPEILGEISKYKNQEIGSHTFSHYYCLENGQNVTDFRNDLEAAIKIAEIKGIDLRSLVFPRNQWNSEYLGELKKCGITSYRGNENSWIYKAVNGTEETIIRRALRLLDSYINISGFNNYNFDTIGTAQPYNIPSSRFLRPVSQKISVFESFRKKRIINAIKQSALDNKIFHLWWHPHNWGLNLEDNVNFLESILSFFVEMKHQYGMKSLNMGEISKLISDCNKLCQKK